MESKGGSEAKAHRDRRRQEQSGEVEALRRELEAERRKVEEYTTLLKRLQADFENHVKRSEVERKEFAKTAAKDLVLKLLDVFDTLDLAVKVDPKDGEGRRILDGFRRVRDQFKTVLAQEGVEEIPTDGVFSHEVHEAVETVEDTGKPDGTIVDVVQRGYKLNNKVIRSSKVVVVKNKR